MSNIISLIERKNNPKVLSENTDKDTNWNDVIKQNELKQEKLKREREKENRMVTKLYKLKNKGV